MKPILPGGEPFYLPGGPTGCLLLHGFTATPKEMRPLGDHLVRHGYSVLAPRLAGHATDPDDLARSRGRDWLASAADGYFLLRGSCSRVFLLGLSLGGALCLLLASQLEAMGMVLFSTPFRLPGGPRLRLVRPILRPLSLVWRHSRKGPREWFDAQAAREHLTYPVRSLRAVAELDSVLKRMRLALPSVRTPTLLIHSRDDRFVTPEHMTQIQGSLGSAWVETRWIEGSSHALTQDARKDEVFAASVDFLRRVETGRP
jgi:carboxylesterase